MGFATPKVVISKCLGFAHCYYSGQMFNIDFLNQLEDFVEYFPVCPEMEIGLGVPRQTIRIVRDKETYELKLIQPRTKKDLTKAMGSFSEQFLSEFDEIDGFIFKERSPSCGHKDIKVYSGIEGQVIHHNGVGFFAQKAFDLFPHTAVESDGRLNNLRLREHFLTKLFGLANFRSISSTEKRKMKNLVNYHANNKYLLMAYDQEKLREMGRIVANHKDLPIHKVYNIYEEKLNDILDEPPHYKAIINVLQHIYGYFKKELTTEEKNFFLNIIEKYRDNKIPLSVPVHLLRSWIIEYDIDYLKEQTFINPFPEELIDLTDSGKNNDRL
ncbi:MAG TPA: DUF523 and DUF1722 domain-containing protein [Halanaerobiales bacterium]|nr:DUF523 and DUF1722 domain-containing protein [Halanaerobiales bacterium]